MKRFAILLLAACGGEAAAPDAATDAPVFELPGCPVDFDHVYIADLVEFLPDGDPRAHDVDGDGDIDNELGPVAELVNPTFAENIEHGTATAFVMPELVLPPPASPVAITAFLPGALDADDPPDPSNNFDDGELEISLRTFDASCRPRLPIDIVQTGTHLDGLAEVFEIQSQRGLAEVRGVVLDGEVTEDGERLETVASGGFTTCALDRLSFPGTTTGSALGGLVALGLQPDLDHDADGLEQLALVDGVVAECTDGDGTVIEGAACPCDPRITDGMSGSIHATWVPARIVGTW